MGFVHGSRHLLRRYLLHLLAGLELGFRAVLDGGTSKVRFGQVTVS
jgi:hypothetical protein